MLRTKSPSNFAFGTIAFSLFLAASAFGQEASVAIKLSPAGGFTGKTTGIKGEAVLDSSGTVRAKGVVADLRKLATGISLRDQHTQEKLETTKFPSAILVEAIGKNGKGKGIVEIRGVRKTVEGTYEVDDKTLRAKFPIKLSDFNIKDIRYMGIGVKDDAMINVQIPVRTDSAGQKSK